LRKASSGECRFGFTPDPAKSFNRGRTDYFLHRRRNTPGQPDTSKSLGELLGRVTGTARDHFAIATAATLHNGDGLCYFDRQGELVGLKANRVDGGTVYHRERKSPDPGTEIYRNLDVAFHKQLEASDSCRVLKIAIVVEETADGLVSTIEDEDGICSRQELPLVKEVARQPGTSAALVERQMQKSGTLPLRVTAVRVNISEALFVRAAEANELRRLAFEAHLQARLVHYRREQFMIVASDTPWLSTRVTVLDNITNSRARQFYRRHGVEEFVLPDGGVAAEPEMALMTSRYCLRNQLGLCPWSGKTPKSAAPPLFIRDNTGQYRLEFVCSRCEMVVLKNSGRKKGQ
jgi:putative protease